MVAHYMFHDSRQNCRQTQHHVFNDEKTTVRNITLTHTQQLFHSLNIIYLKFNTPCGSVLVKNLWPKTRPAFWALKYPSLRSGDFRFPLLERVHTDLPLFVFLCRKSYNCQCNVFISAWVLQCIAYNIKVHLKVAGNNPTQCKLVQGFSS